MKLCTHAYHERNCLPSLNPVVFGKESEKPDTKPGVFMTTDGIGTVQRNIRKHFFLHRDHQYF